MLEAERVLALEPQQALDVLEVEGLVAEPDRRVAAGRAALVGADREIVELEPRGGRPGHEHGRRGESREPTTSGGPVSHAAPPQRASPKPLRIRPTLWGSLPAQFCS